MEEAQALIYARPYAKATQCKLQDKAQDSRRFEFRAQISQLANEAAEGWPKALRLIRGCTKRKITNGKTRGERESEREKSVSVACQWVRCGELWSLDNCFIPLHSTAYQLIAKTHHLPLSSANCLPTAVGGESEQLQIIKVKISEG